VQGLCRIAYRCRHHCLLPLAPPVLFLSSPLPLSPFSVSVPVPRTCAEAGMTQVIQQEAAPDPVRSVLSLSLSLSFFLFICMYPTRLQGVGDGESGRAYHADGDDGSEDHALPLTHRQRLEDSGPFIPPFDSLSHNRLRFLFRQRA
jgi:hypothetical protein